MDITRLRPPWLGVREALIALMLACVVYTVLLAQEQAERVTALRGEIAREEQAHALTRLQLNAVDFRAANREMETEVRKDVLDERIREQAARADELERETERLRQQLIRETNCVTPSNIRNSDGL